MQGQIGITDCKTRRLISTHVRVRAAQSEDLGADALRALTITTPAGARGEENQEVCVGVTATCVVTLVSGYHHHPCSLLSAVHMHLQYLDEELLRGGLKSGLFMRGYLRVNKHNPQYGACLVTAADMRCDPSYSPHVIAWVHTGRKRMWRWDSSRSG